MWSFDDDAIGSAPASFDYVVTAMRAPGRWVIVREGNNRVLAQVDRDKTPRRFAMALPKGITAKNLRLSVRAKPIAGEVEMVAGLVWRYQDSENYYVARWNSDSVRVDRVVDGQRQLLPPSEIKIKLAADQWHLLTVRHTGDEIEVSVNETRVFAGRDETYASAGRVGVWIKADSLTYFDDLALEDVP